MFDRKILFPHQYYYPYMDFANDRADKEKREEFLMALTQVHKEVMLYIHIPFCDSRCTFCGFDKKYDLDEIERYIEHLLQELEFYANFDFTISNIHIGGGTPTLVPARLLTKVITYVRTHFKCRTNMEINIEGSATSLYRDEVIDFLKQNDITRVSTGVQTFHPKLRQIFNTKATLDEVELTLDVLRKNQIKVFADILFGYPDFGLGERPKDIVLNDIRKVMEFNVAGIDFSHLYPYGNKLAELVNKMNVTYPTTSQLLDLMQESMEYMESSGYKQETSYGFVKEGHILIEKAYYGGADNVSDTLAVGSGAFGLLGDYKYRNPQYGGYMRMEVPSFVQMKKLTAEQKENINIVGFPKVLTLSKRQWSLHKYQDRFDTKIHNLLDWGMIEECETEYVVSQKGRLWVDNIYAYMLEEGEWNQLQKNVKIIQFK